MGLKAPSSTEGDIGEERGAASGDSVPPPDFPLTLGQPETRRPRRAGDLPKAEALPACFPFPPGPPPPRVPSLALGTSPRLRPVAPHPLSWEWPLVSF